MKKILLISSFEEKPLQMGKTQLFYLNRSKPLCFLKSDIRFWEECVLNKKDKEI